MVTQLKLDSAGILADIDGDKRFFCQDGCIIKNLTELSECLNHMTDEVFHHHVTSGKNDFSNWVRDVLGDDKLASELYDADSTQEASKIINERLASFPRNQNQYRRSKKRR
jgi:hypothetical protein